ncbi:Heterokaryon incompatibility protein 6, OR allele [Pseudocercospora fuligena]|uniref:Heterokaryon incompatibility protein 6, OR allele n=1 Tax=Pseudocercospora fuligena TaxID=685502 RepID=A0A8H6RN83_9PEZI|nr:Heterokaryon incompatibility protein 6, OR allele [Pseudocercospora fuligena]
MTTAAELERAVTGPEYAWQPCNDKTDFLRAIALVVFRSRIPVLRTLSNTTRSVYMEAPDPLYPLRGKHYEPPYRELVRDRLIRLVELLPGKDDDEIQTRLSIVDLRQEPTYEAISYVWGDAQDRIRISCQGKDFFITRNLYNAFRRLRLSDRTRVLWADAMCIDQTNNVEKSHHVAFMNEVYSRAEKVLICIHEDTQMSEEKVAALLKEYLGRATVHQFRVEDMPVIDSIDQTMENPDWHAVARLFRSAWFTRVWVLQEAGVAQDVKLLYGRAELDYRALMSLARWIVRCAGGLIGRYQISSLTIHTDWSDWTENWRKNQNYIFGVVDFLSAAKGLHCVNPHDHVYGLLGHPLLRTSPVDGQSTSLLTPDYYRPVLDTYRQLTELLLERDGLKVLSAVEHDADTIAESQAPSWVARRDMDIVWNSMGYYEHFLYRASDEIPVDVLFVDGKRLCTQCLFVDTIEHVFPFSAKEDDWQVNDGANALAIDGPLKDTLNEIRVKFEEHYPVQAATLSKDFSLTLCTGLTNYERAEDDCSQHERNFLAFWNMFVAAIRGVTLDQLRRMPGQEYADSFYSDLLLACKGRSFLITAKGRLGLGPLISRPADSVCILRGARVPFIVRQVTSQSEYDLLGGPNRLVGEAYVHGMMEGEMVKGSGVPFWELISLV